MKKLFILAALALVASAACTKNEVFENTPDSAIGFQVANYLPQTKTALPSAVKFEDYTSFTTDAWFHPADGGSAQRFMNAETVSMDATTGVWSPSRSYFWPKTGSINFYSQAGSPAATVTDGTAKYGASPSTYVTIDTTNNAVLASAAYRYSRADWNLNTYAGTNGFTYGTDNTDVVGVPTLFHHMLAKVTFIIKFDATAGTSDDSWTLTVNSAALNYANEGLLEITFTDPGSKGLAWPWTANEEIGWTANPTKTSLAAPGTPKAITQAGIDGTTSSISNGRTLFGEVSVLPQDLTAATGTGATLSLNYTLAYTHTGAATITETVNLTDAVVNSNPALGSIALTDFTSNDYDAWYMNHKYVYTVTIKPDHTITFSPAIIPWVDGNNTGYTYPVD